MDRLSWLAHLQFAVLYLSWLRMVPGKARIMAPLPLSRTILLNLMGRADRAEYEAKYTAWLNCEMLMKIHQKMIGQRL